MSCTAITPLPDVKSAGSELGSSGRRTLIYCTTVLVLMLLASVIYAPWVNNGPVLCPFRLMTGLPCPGCGLTRSFCAMSQGHFALAARYHLLGPAVYLASLISLPLMLYQIIANRRIQWFYRLFYSHRFAWALAVVLGGYQMLRILAIIHSGRLFTLIAHAPLIDLVRRI